MSTADTDVQRNRRSRGRASRPVIAASVAAGLIAILGASTNSSANTHKAASAATASKHFKIAYVPGQTENAFYDTIGTNIEKVAKADGDTVVTQGSPNFDPTDQTNVLNAVLAQKPNVLIVAPTDPVALRAPIQRFLSEGIPVITVDTALTNTQGVISAIAGDNQQGGRIAADALARAIGGTGAVQILNIAPGIPTLDARVAGFIAEVKAKYPKIKLLSEQYGGGSPSTNEVKARQLLLANSDIRGFFGVTEVNAEGASSADTAAGKGSSVKTIAFDGTPNEVKVLKAGGIIGMIVQQPNKEGQLAMQYAQDYLTGKKSAIKRSVSLAPTLVTKQNLNKASVQAILYKGAPS